MINLSKPSSDFPTLQLRNGTTIELKYEKPDKGTCEYCSKQLEAPDKWQMLSTCLCTNCLLQLPAGGCVDARYWWVEHTKKVHHQTRCSKCSAGARNGYMGFYHPNISRCSGCADAGRGGQHTWTSHDSSKGRFPWGAAIAVAGGAVAGASKVVTAAQVHHVLLEGMKNGQLSSEEITRAVVEGLEGPFGNTVEVIKALCTSNPAPEATEIIAQGANPGVVDAVVNSFSGGSGGLTDGADVDGGIFSFLSWIWQ